MFLFPKLKLKAVGTSYFLTFLPEDGIMADGPLAYFLAYQTDKRVVIIPHERGSDIYQTLLSITQFDLNYAVISKNHTEKYHPPATEYIQQNFEFISTIMEDDDVYTIYKVPQAVKFSKRKVQAKNKCLLCGTGVSCGSEFVPLSGVLWN